jgi:hypothetical protein
MVHMRYLQGVFGAVATSYAPLAWSSTGAELFILGLNDQWEAKPMLVVVISLTHTHTVASESESTPCSTIIRLTHETQTLGWEKGPKCNNHDWWYRAKHTSSQQGHGAIRCAL